MMLQQEKKIVEVLNAFATALMSNDVVCAEDAVEKFINDFEIAFSEEGKQELINHIKSLL